MWECLRNPARSIKILPNYTPIPRDNDPVERELLGPEKIGGNKLIFSHLNAWLFVLAIGGIINLAWTTYVFTNFYKTTASSSLASKLTIFIAINSDAEELTLVLS